VAYLKVTVLMSFDLFLYSLEYLVGEKFAKGANDDDEYIQHSVLIDC